MMTTIKICGLSDEKMLDVALDSGADMIGLVFHAASPRNVDIRRAAELGRRAKGHAETVALVVDAPDTELDEIVEIVRPDWLQLHGAETPERVASLRDRYGLRTMKAIPVRTMSDVSAADSYHAVTDLILFDAKPPAGALLPGGNGMPFDWTVLDDVAAPFMLSGGLNPENVGTAIRLVQPFGVDVSSGVEISRGRKDADLIRAFIAAARSAAIAETAS